MKRTYLDHTATTPLDPAVLDAMLPFMHETFGNASSVHWFGRQAKTALEQSREKIASLISARPGEVFFTSGGTESDNLAVLGAVQAARAGGRAGVVTSAAEHHAVLDTCAFLQKEGRDVTIMPVDHHGSVHAHQVRAVAGSATALVTVMHANNEVGTINNIAAIADATHAAGALLHTDAVQSFGKIRVHVEALGVDLMSLSAHKIYGPKGIGALFVKRGTAIDPLMKGGGQERGTRPGTESVALAVGFARAAEIAVAGMEQEMAREQALRDTLAERLTSMFPAILINGDPEHRLPHILNVSFDSGKMSLEGDMLVMNMDLRGVAVTSGSACTSGSMQPSHVLLAMGRDERTAQATLRFAFGRGNTDVDVDHVVDALSGAIGQMTA